MEFCSNSCNRTWQNIHNNPTTLLSVRKKISAARRGRPTTLGRILPESQKNKIANSLRGRKLSLQHKKSISKGVIKSGVKPPRNTHLKGPNHPLWKGGHSLARHKDYRSKKYKTFRNTVLERDNYTCRDCNKRGGRLEVHHIKPWGPYPKLRYKISNGITLCRSCHNKTKIAPRPITVGPRTLSELLSNSPSI